MVLSAYMTYMTCIYMCFCSRRGGGTSYGEVVRSAFGQKMEEAVSWMLGILLLFAMVAYHILIRDIWTPLVQQATSSDVEGNYVLFGIMVLLLPLLFQRSLYALRNVCYVGFASITVLCIALCIGGYKEMVSSDREDFKIEYFKIPSPQDLLAYFPIVITAFLCHFNIIAVQNAITKPTRERTQNLAKYSIGASFLLMYVFGLAGYIYGGNDTQGNILLNVPMERPAGDTGGYYAFLLGRIGCGITMMLAVPMSLLPCREALLEIVNVYFHEAHREGRPQQRQWWMKVLSRWGKEPNEEFVTEEEVVEIQTAARGSGGRRHSVLSQKRPSVLLRRTNIQEDFVFRNTLTHYGSTLLIVAACYLGATVITGVAVVWSIVGSSLAFFIAFILPSACFTVMEAAVPTVAEGGDRHETWIQLAWVFLIFSIVGTVICTINNTVGF